jgi:hypothetical protein
MFTIDTVIDTYVTQTKSLLAHVQHEPAKNAMLNMLNAQEAFAKSMAKQYQSATESAVKQLQNTTKIDWSKLFTIPK